MSYREKRVICKPRREREASGETSPASTLTLDSQPPEVEANKFLFVALPGLWYLWGDPSQPNAGTLPLKASSQKPIAPF